FDPPLPDPLPHRLLRGSTHPPQPLLPLIPPPGVLELLAGEPFVFGVRVLGRLDDNEEQRLVRALEAMGELPMGRDHGHLAVEGVTRRDSPRADDQPEPKPTPTRATLTLHTPG